MLQKFALIFVIFAGCLFAQQTCPTGTIPIQAGTTYINSGGQLVLSTGLCINPLTGAVTTVPGGSSCTTCYTNQVTPPAGLWLPYFQPNTINQQGNIQLSNQTPLSGTRIQTASGPTTANDCAKFLANGDIGDAGSPCGSGGGSGITQIGGDTGPVITLGPNVLTMNTSTHVLDILPSIVMLLPQNNAPTGQWDASATAAGSKPLRNVATLAAAAVGGNCTLNEMVFVTTGTIGAYYCSTAAPAAWTAVGGGGGGATLSIANVSASWIGGQPGTQTVSLTAASSNLVPVVGIFSIPYSSMTIKHLNVYSPSGAAGSSCIVSFYDANSGNLVGTQSNAFTPAVSGTPVTANVTFSTPVVLTNNGSTTGTYFKMLMCSIPSGTITFQSDDSGFNGIFTNTGVTTKPGTGYLSTQGSLTAPASLGTINIYPSSFSVALWGGA